MEVENHIDVGDIGESGSGKGVKEESSWGVSESEGRCRRSLKVEGRNLSWHAASTPRRIHLGEDENMLPLNFHSPTVHLSQCSA